MVSSYLVIEMRQVCILGIYLFYKFDCFCKREVREVIPVAKCIHYKRAHSLEFIQFCRLHALGICDICKVSYPEAE